MKYIFELFDDCTYITLLQNFNIEFKLIYQYNT